MNTHRLVLYKNFMYQDIFEDITWLMNNYDNEYYNKKDLVRLCYENVNKLVELASSFGFEGNLWHSFLAHLLANHENAFSTSCEMKGKIEGSLNDLACNDFRIFKSLFDYDFQKLEEVLEINCFSLIKTYQNVCYQSKVFNKRIRDEIHDLGLKLVGSKDENEFLSIITNFYEKVGVGILGLHKAFRIGVADEKVEIIPISNVEHIYFKDLVGYELQKKKLIDNTEAFLEGKKANNVLLFGDSGTGKSSSIKAVLNEYYDKGIRMIEIYKHQFKYLSAVIQQIKDRNYKFIILMDDLSFEDYEIEYKYLKAIIEGGLEKKPDNVLIYATSNRRHLIREKWSDKEDRREDLHASDTVEEKLSLAARFGVSIFFIAPNKKEYENIVKVLAEKYNIYMDEEKLFLEANKWELSHGGLSGRTATQFINYLLGFQK
ncbi:MAG: ATP-binding protein [Clostridiales bacterium]|nr:ATP-binding protein [Clostridiales bacterium]